MSLQVENDSAYSLGEYPGDPPKDTSPQDLWIEIGGSSYLLSVEAQRYIRRDIYSALFYESPKSVLIVNEPHESVEGQFNLYKGLEIFFRDNPSLVEKTVFLAEGYPANQLISVQSLIAEEPKPSDRLIKEVLGTFLITGYMAYAWKHQQDIPIIGTENDWFYDMSRVFAIAYAKNPNALFQRVNYKDGPTIDTTFFHALLFSFVVRNKSIADTLIDKTRYYENPVLFVGRQHFKSLNEAEFNFIKDFAYQGTLGPFGPYAREVAAEAENLGLYHYLERGQVGFTLLTSVGTITVSDEDAYVQLFKAQQEGEWKSRSRESHRKYLEWLLSQRGSQQGITTRSSPETATQFVRALKGKGVVYDTSQENKENIPTGQWGEVGRDEVRAKLGKETMWDERITPRGGDYERLRGANLGSNCPVIDHYDAEERLVISMKSLDLRSHYYQDSERVDYVVREYIEKLSEFSGVFWNGNYIRIGRNFDFKHLELAIPAGAATTIQHDKLLELQEHARGEGVILDIVEVP